jgi:hypothetical protein
MNETNNNEHRFLKVYLLLLEFDGSREKSVIRQPTFESSTPRQCDTMRAKIAKEAKTDAWDTRHNPDFTLHFVC